MTGTRIEAAVLPVSVFAVPLARGRFPAGLLMRVCAVADWVAVTLALRPMRGRHFPFAFLSPFLFFFFRFIFFFRFGFERFFFGGEHVEAGQGRRAVGGARGQHLSGEEQYDEEGEADGHRVHPSTRRLAAFSGSGYFHALHP